MYPRQSLTPRCSAKPAREPAHPDVTPRGFQDAAGAEAEVMVLVPLSYIVCHELDMILGSTCHRASE